MVPSVDGRVAYAVLYLPTSPPAELPADVAGPYVLAVHGGPTGHTPVRCDAEIAYFTSRGIGVAEVNYGGSTGYGRPYRDALRGNWGVVDVEDCEAVASWLLCLSVRRGCSGVRGLIGKLNGSGSVGHRWHPWVFDHEALSRCERVDTVFHHGGEVAPQGEPCRCALPGAKAAAIFCCTLLILTCRRWTVAEGRVRYVGLRRAGPPERGCDQATAPWRRRRRRLSRAVRLHAHDRRVRPSQRPRRPAPTAHRRRHGPLRPAQRVGPRVRLSRGCASSRGSCRRAARLRGLRSRPARAGRHRRRHPSRMPRGPRRPPRGHRGSAAC